MAANGTSRHLKTFMQMIGDGKLHAPNLKSAHFWLHRGQDRSNAVIKKFVTKHMLGLRWMNPNALVFLRDSPEFGTAHVEFELWNGRRSGFAVAKTDSAEKVVAKLMFAARDTSLDDADVRSVMDGDEVFASAPADGVWEPGEASVAVPSSVAVDAESSSASLADAAAAAAASAVGEAEARH